MKRYMSFVASELIYAPIKTSFNSFTPESVWLLISFNSIQGFQNVLKLRRQTPQKWVIVESSLTLWLPDQICHSPYSQPYNSHVSSENLVLDQLIIPKLICFFILIIYLVDIVLILYWYCKEKFSLGHLWELKG